MRLYIFGVRGSTPAPGAEFVRYGGHTSCIALAHDDDADPTLVIDAGTGIRQLSAARRHRAFSGSILLGHLHWDHTQGLPFFPAGDNPASRVDLYIPDQGDPVEVLARAVSPPHFPIRPEDLQGHWRFCSMVPGHHRIEGFDVEARDIPHKGGRTFGFRVTDGTATIAYLSDHSPVTLGPGDDGEGALHEAALELAAGADVLLHDAQHLSAEFEARAHYGHSTVGYAVALAHAAGAHRLLLFHHDPNRSDDALDAIAAEWSGRDGVTVEVAAEGRVLELPG